MLSGGRIEGDGSSSEGRMNSWESSYTVSLSGAEGMGSDGGSEGDDSDIKGS